MYTNVGRAVRVRVPYFGTSLFREGAVARREVASYEAWGICIDPLVSGLKGYGL